VTDDQKPYDDDPAQRDELPDLAAIPEEGWKDALRPLTRARRNQAVLRLGWKRGGAAARVKLELEAEEDAWKLRDVPTPGPPRPSVPDAADATTRVRQINLKLQPQEHQDLVQAAKRLGLKPTVLARLLVKRGVELALRA
jgi:hypothetical protein